MTGKVDDGDTVTLIPAADLILNVGDIILARVSGRDYLHLIKAVSGGRFQIGNNRGRINGWVMQRSIYGKAVTIERSN